MFRAERAPAGDTAIDIRLNTSLVAPNPSRHGPVLGEREANEPPHGHGPFSRGAGGGIKRCGRDEVTSGRSFVEVQQRNPVPIYAADVRLPVSAMLYSMPRRLIHRI